MCHTLPRIGYKMPYNKYNKQTTHNMETVIGESVKKTNRLVAIDTARKNGGIMAEVVANVQESFNDWLDGPIIRIGANDVPWPYNKNLEAEAYPSAEKIANHILEKLI